MGRGGKPVVMNPDIKPVGDIRSHLFRKERLSLLIGSVAYDRFAESPYFTPEATRFTMEGTQFDGENHRRITPYLQESFEGLAEKIDGQVGRMNIIGFPQGGDPRAYDVV